MVMKALAPSLQRVEAVQIAPSRTGMYTDSQAGAIRAARSEMLECLTRARPGSIVPLSLDRVELSASCIASILGPALKAIVEGELPGRYVVGVDRTGRSAWDADAGLKKESERIGRKLACVWEGADHRKEVVGNIDPQVRATYMFALERWESASLPTVARDLMVHANLTIQAASNRLAKASVAGLLFASDREAVAGGGAQYVFLPVG